MSQHRVAICPSCHQEGRFDFSGNQHCPADIAARLGLPTVIALWTCPACHTTISEPDLLPGAAGDDIPPTNRRAKQIKPPLSIVAVYNDNTLSGNTPTQTVTW